MERIVNGGFDITIVTGSFLVFAWVSWLFSIVATIVTYGGFTVRRRDDHLVIDYGLLDRKRQSIPVKRLQSIRIVEGVLRQPFGYSEVRFDSAGLGGVLGESGMLYPMIHRSQMLPFLREACPELIVAGIPAIDNRVPRRALGRYVVAETAWLVIVTAIAFGAARYWSLGPEWWPSLGLLALPFAAWLGYQCWADAGWGMEQGLFSLRSRSIARVTVVTTARRLQYRKLESNVLQRRADLVTFSTAVPSGATGVSMSLQHLDRAQGHALAAVLADQARPGRRRETEPVDHDGQASEPV